MKHRKYGDFEEWGNLIDLGTTCEFDVKVSIAKKNPNSRPFWMKWVIYDYTTSDDWANVELFEDYESAKAYAEKIVYSLGNI